MAYKQERIACYEDTNCVTRIATSAKMFYVFAGIKVKASIDPCLPTSFNKPTTPIITKSK